MPTDVFADFAPAVAPPSALRAAITANHRGAEPEGVAALLKQAAVTPAMQAAIRATARQLVLSQRRGQNNSAISELVQEYSLSSQEGVALMCLAEALLRTPDTATRDALIRDKISNGHWASHLGPERSLFVNAATWGLVVTGKLTATVNDRSLAAALSRLISRFGEPLIRQGVDIAMRMMGEQFVSGRNIDEALRRSRELEQQGFGYSYDMLGEAAVTAHDAERYYRDYENAIHAIGQVAAGRGVYAGPGISIKLSALHPRYARAQAERVMSELLPRVTALARLAKRYDIGLNIDAEESERLELSLDLLECLCLDPELANWNGMGFVVQAYGKRCLTVLDFIIDLARRADRRIMVRLVKGAYWDTEIKRAQLDGMDDFPVFTRKLHTDVCYIAAARRLLAATDAVFAQFATHNAQSLATIYHLAGPDFTPGDYEFQCLHGMGEPLYAEVVGAAKLNRPCRIYAPVGTHETLLAYLVRRLLENGANSSFVHRIADPEVSVDELIADPVEVVQAAPMPGTPHPQIAKPAELFGATRQNSRGLDLTNEATLASLNASLKAGVSNIWEAGPRLVAAAASGVRRPVRNPGDHDDIVGFVTEASEAEAAQAATHAAASGWAKVPLAQRVACLLRAADIMQQRMPILIGLLMREAGKTAANAVGEVREAIDFLRYYAAQADSTLPPQQPALGAVVCISPWNFPLSIFTGQIAAALAAGNAVLAKPAEETPLIAAACVRLLHQAGVSIDGLQLLPGDGRIGAALVAAPEVAGVVFTGSTEVARLIQTQLAQRLSPRGQPIVLIAETGGQNAMIVDSSALPEQVVADVISSAFDSAGQRCSALRILCLQDEIAGRTIDLLRGAVRELHVGRTDRLCVDVGPVITQEAKATIERHIAAMRQLGRHVEQTVLDDATSRGTFVPPTIIELQSVTELTREVFGPVLHIVRFRRDQLDQTIDAINASGYGLTFGLHTRLDETIAHVTGRVQAGNLYVNRNMVGAVVGVQPFGGRGLSGTGPKAGGPRYLHRLMATTTSPPRAGTAVDAALDAFATWLHRKGADSEATIARDIGKRSALGFECELPGPVGERNLYALRPRGRILLLPQTSNGLYRQIAAALATGNHIAIDAADRLRNLLEGLPASVASRLHWITNWSADAPFAGALIEGDAERVLALSQRIAALPGPLVPVQATSTAQLLAEPTAYALDWLLEEVSTSVNTAAAGGNASLMAIG
jgi:RHH-type proline utilization regulon transcriptional repressor/proline dehydrogenase/delta 1-pyrroline-5-carboxylate dehydrogenase